MKDIHNDCDETHDQNYDELSNDNNVYHNNEDDGKVDKLKDDDVVDGCCTWIWYNGCNVKLNLIDDYELWNNDDSHCEIQQKHDVLMKELLNDYSFFS